MIGGPATYSHAKNEDLMKGLKCMCIWPIYLYSLRATRTDQANVVCPGSAINPQRELKFGIKVEERCNEKISANTRVVWKLPPSGDGRNKLVDWTRRHCG